MHRCLHSSSALHFKVLVENDDSLNLFHVDAKKSGNDSPSVSKSQSEVKFQYRINQKYKSSAISI